MSSSAGSRFIVEQEVFLGGAGLSELRFQGVHRGHQLVNIGFDPTLFGKEGDGGEKVGQASYLPFFQRAGRE